MNRIISLIVISLFAIGSVAQAQTSTPLSESAVSLGLSISVAANELAFPMGMVVLEDGSLLVATSPSTSGNFYDSSGAILNLVDSDGDGTLDQRSDVATGLPGSLVALAVYGDVVIATSAQSGDESIIFFRAAESWDSPLDEIGRIHLGFVNALHQSYGLAVRATPEDPDTFDLFFNIGAAGNDDAGPEVAASGLIDATLAPASIYMMTIDPTGTDLSASEPVQIASGLRNAAALLIHPVTGDLWIGENGIDGFDNPIVSFSADELDVIPADQIGTEIVDFGFPDGYIDYATGQNVNDDPAFVDFLPRFGSESEGIAGITLIPDSFPEEIAGGILAGFHGQFDLTGIDNEENPVRFVDLTTGTQVEIISNDAPDIGHLDSFASGPDAIYIADFCNASLSSSPACGVIYRLTVYDE